METKCLRENAESDIALGNISRYTPTPLGKMKRLLFNFFAVFCIHTHAQTHTHIHTHGTHMSSQFPFKNHNCLNKNNETVNTIWNIYKFVLHVPATFFHLFLLHPPSSPLLPLRPLWHHTTCKWCTYICTQCAQLLRRVLHRQHLAAAHRHLAREVSVLPAPPPYAGPEKPELVLRYFPAQRTKR